MGVFISAPVSNDGKHRSEDPHKCCTAGIRLSDSSIKHNSAKRAARNSSEVGTLPHVVPKDGESVSTSCALSHTASMHNFAIATSDPRAVTAPTFSKNAELQPQHASPEANTIASKSTVTRPALTLQKKCSCHNAHAPTNALITPDDVDVVQIDHTSTHPEMLLADLDDFELAYSRGFAGLNASFCNFSRSFPAHPSATTYPPLYMPSEVGETLAFVTLHRTRFTACRICRSGLPHRAKFCPQCGTCVEQKSCCDNTSSISDGRASSPYATSLLVAPHSDSGNRSSNWIPEDDGSFFIASPTSKTDVVATAVEKSDVFTLQQRHAFVRYVRVLRSRDILGLGTSATVYCAIDTRTGQQLAVKESLINQNAPDELATVRNELRQLAALRHPYIVEYFGCRVEAVEDNYVSSFQSSVVSSHASGAPDAFDALDVKQQEMRKRNLDITHPAPLQPSSHLCRRQSVSPSLIRVLMLMELVECGTLGPLLADFPCGMPERTVRRFAAQLVDAVCYVHDCGLSHRDIKPDNILLASDGTIRLSDFGCAMRGVSSLTANGIHSISGTPAYMPPESLTCLEQATVDWTLQGKAQDVWAIGCTVYHLLTAEPPWCALKSLTPYALLLHIQARDFPVKAKLLSREALDFCHRCFERDPCRRITAVELARHPFINQP